MYLDMLSRLKIEGKLIINPSYISTGGSGLSSGVRTHAQSAFPQAQVSEVYSATECSPIAMSCPIGNLHLFEDAALVEPVDRLDEPVPVDTFSHHVLVTNLLRTFQPIIRYRLMDEVMICSRPCGCGSVFPVLQVRGRSNPDFPVTMNDGRRGSVLAIDLESVFSSLFDVRQFQVTYSTMNRFDVDIYVYGTLEDVEDYRLRHGTNIMVSFLKFAAARGFDRQVKFVIQYKQMDISKSKRMAFQLQLDADN